MADPKASAPPDSAASGLRTGQSQPGGCSSGAESIFETSLKHLNPNNQYARSQPSSIRCFFNALTRKKPLDCRTDTNLNRCLNLLDLTALANLHLRWCRNDIFVSIGVGSTLGLGLYVLAGQVASNKAGPAVVISFALAALASAFSALCYAEFAGRVPRAGSAYAYSYITVGEFVAFIIGWNLVLEYVIGASSVARGFSGYLCVVAEHVVGSLGSNQGTELSGLAPHPAASSNQSTVLLHHMAKPAAVPMFTWLTNYVAEYFDWPSIVIIVLLTAFIMFGVKESTNVTLAFTAVNLLVVVTVVISSISSLDLHNWHLGKNEVPPGYGQGGFMPYGWSGVIAGSATCFFGFIGFDTIASSAEEAKNPKRNVPLSIILSLFISFIAYMAIAIVQTLLWPYYDQNKITILPYIFGRLDMPITYWIVLLGAIAGLASSQLGGMYPLPRILYSMAQDRLIYGYLAHVNKKLRLPVRATIIGSIFIAALSCLLDIQDLADMVSIGTLAAYSLVSLSVLILRYEDRSDAVDDSTIINNHLTFTDILSTPIEERDSLPQGPACRPNETRETGNRKLPTKTGGQESTACALHNQPKSTVLPISNDKGASEVPLKPQLNAGFNSWFKSNPIAAEPITMADPKRQSFLDLLIVWKADDQVRNRSPDDRSSHQSKMLISAIVVLTILLDVVALGLTSQDSAKHHPIVRALHEQQLIDPLLLLGSTGCIVLVVLAATMLMLSRLPVSQSVPSDMFQVPLVPLVPTLSILVNTFLMLNLSYLTWVRFTVWMAVGLFIYFTYGIWNSKGYLLYLDHHRQ